MATLRARVGKSAVQVQALFSTGTTTSTISLHLAKEAGVKAGEEQADVADMISGGACAVSMPAKPVKVDVDGLVVHISPIISDSAYHNLVLGMDWFGMLGAPSMTFDRDGGKLVLKDGKTIRLQQDPADLAPGSDPNVISLAHLVQPSAQTARGLKEMVAARVCSKCSSAADLRRCSGCKAVYYCSSTCQTGDWKRHKPACKAAAAAAVADAT
jgi:hypothetical protein